MYYLIATAGSHGDVLPLIAIGKELALRSVDNQVIIYGTPLFSKYVTDETSNLTFVPVSTDEFYYEILNMVSQRNPIKAMAQIMRTMASASGLLIDAMSTDVVDNQTVLIASSMTPAHRVLAEIYANKYQKKIPTVSLHLAPAVMYSEKKLGRALPIMDLYREYLGYPCFNRAFWRWVEHFISKPNLTKPLNQVRERYHLPKVHTPVFNWINDADLLIGLFPAWFAKPESDWDNRLKILDFPLYDSGKSHPMTNELITFLSQCQIKGQSPVVLSAGTATSNAHDFFAESVKACQIAGLPAVLISHISDQIPDDLPDTILAVNYAPFSQLLPKASVFIHHGGVGSTAQAILAGIPQLVRPVAFDQFDNAERVVNLGIGLEVLPKHYQATIVAKTLQQLHNPVYKIKCQHYSKQLKFTAIADSCDEIEQLMSLT